MSKFLKAIVNIVLLAAILSAGALLIPPLLGVTTKVSDGTGNTNLSRGSVTYATSAQAADLETGDKILQDDSNGSYVYTVRAVAADTSTYTLEDEVSGATQDQQLTGGVQKVAVTLPVIGMLSLTLQTREGVIILGLCVAFLIILFILSEVWRKDGEEEDEEEEDDEDGEEDAEEEQDQPLSRKEKRRLKKEQKKKAREEEDEEEDEREETEISEDPEEEESREDVPEEEEEIRPLEEEPEEEAVVDTDFLRQTDTADRPEESVQEKEEEDLARSLAAAVGELMGEEKAEAGFGEEQDVFGVNAEEEEEAIYIEETESETAETEEKAEPAEEAAGAEEVQEEASAVPEEEDDRKPVELAIPVHTAEELLKKAEEAGDHPKVIEDRENGVTILDYSDIL